MEENIKTTSNNEVSTTYNPFEESRQQAQTASYEVLGVDPETGLNIVGETEKKSYTGAKIAAGVGIGVGAAVAGFFMVKAAKKRKELKDKEHDYKVAQEAIDEFVKQVKSSGKDIEALLKEMKKSVVNEETETEEK